MFLAVKTFHEMEQLSNIGLRHVEAIHQPRAISSAPLEMRGQRSLVLKNPLALVARVLDEGALALMGLQCRLFGEFLAALFCTARICNLLRISAALDVASQARAGISAVFLLKCFVAARAGQYVD